MVKHIAILQALASNCLKAQGWGSTEEKTVSFEMDFFARWSVYMLRQQPHN